MLVITVRIIIYLMRRISLLLANRNNLGNANVQSQSQNENLKSIASADENNEYCSLYSMNQESIYQNT